VGGLLLLLFVATIAFFTKSTPLRWATLAGTVLFLGFVGRGFLSISHLSSAMVVGPGLFLSDLSLLLLVLFTVATTVFWGRIFCGYLCPFGVLQDLLDRFVPRRFRRRMPSWIHDRALWVKYVILVAVLTPAFVEVVAPRLIRRDFSIYQYVEPFGTVFFRSPSVLLWALALGFLAASAVVPRFYCRYVCPLGAALAVVSRVSPFRIRRVEQCTVCKVCEQSCPTGAIRGHEVDFPECVRCSVCEVKLIERAGTCRHEMENVRPRLIQIQVPARRESE
jgi:NosR/NirI family transcriptional regulator, nitrous oxide reductase regulator